MARELESGTHRLAWTQGVTRVRWLMVKVVLTITPLLVASAAVGGLEIVYLNVQGENVNRWAVFDQQAPVIVGATLLAMALGVTFGAVMRRSIVAMATTLVAFVVIRVGIAELARPNYQTPVTVRAQTASFIDTSTQPTGW